jgi:hypothetical protein
MRRHFFAFILTALLYIPNPTIALTPTNNNGSVLDDALRQEIFTEASKLSGYKIPAILPEIRIVPHHVIMETCGETECTRYSAFAPNEPLLVDEKLDLNDVESYSYVLHEAIHVLQFAAKGITDIESLSCSEVLAIEKEAYYLQQKYLEKQRSFLRVTWMIDRISCPDTPVKE